MVPVVIAPDSVVVSTGGRVGHLKGVVVAVSGGVVECWVVVGGETVEVAVDGVVVDVVVGVVISKMNHDTEMKKIINITHSCQFW